MLDKNTYFIREHVGMLKLSDTYDILDPETSEQLAIAREKPGGWIHVLRFVVNKRNLPTKVMIYAGDDYNDESALLFSIHRSFTFLRARVEVKDAQENVIGWFKSKAFSLGGAFRVFDADGGEVALVKGDWKGWNFSFTDSQGQSIGAVTKKWSGMGKELFTSADNYIVTIEGEPHAAKATLLLAAGLAVDVVFKEK